MSPVRNVTYVSGRSPKFQNIPKPMQLKTLAAEFS